MELLILVAGVAILASPILALVAFARSSRVLELERRLRGLEDQVLHLVRAVDRLRAGRAGQDRRTEAPEPGPSPEKPAPAPRSPGVPHVVEETPARRPSPEPAVSRAGEATVPTPVVRRAPDHETVDRLVTQRADSKPAPRPRAAIDWEQWIGVRGAGLLGGVVLALAGILTFKHYVEQGLITPRVRVGGGAVAGLMMLAGSLYARRKELRAVPGALAGAGVVTLYTCAWAAHRLYDLVPFGVSFGVMAAVTAACIALSVLHRAQVVALLGLVGGFAAPLILGADLDRPLSLFGYFLLLDIGLVAVASRMRWPVLGLAGVASTFAYEVLWSVLHLDLESMPLALALMGTFALLFAVGGRWLPGQNGVATRTAGLLLPFLLALHFGTSSLTPHLWPMALLIALLVVGSAWTARDAGLPWLVHAAAGGMLGVVFAWTREVAFDVPLIVELVAIAVGLALLFQGIAEWNLRRPPGASGEEPESSAEPPLPLEAETLAAAGLFLVTLTVGATELPEPAASGYGPWPFLAAWIALALVLARQAIAQARLLPFGAGAVLLALSWAMWGGLHEREPGYPGALRYAALSVGVVALVHGLAWRVAAARRGAGPWVAAGFCVAPLLTVIASSRVMLEDPRVPLVATLVLSLFLTAATLTTRVGAWAPGAVVACVLAQGPARAFAERVAGESWGGSVLLLSCASILVFLAAPFVPRPAEQRSETGQQLWRSAALALLVWVVPVWRLHERVAPGVSVAVVPGLLGAAGLGVFALLRLREPEEAARRVGTVWLAGTGVLLLSIAPAVFVDRFPLAVGAASAGLALALLWRGLDHPGLKVVSVVGVVATLLTVAVSFALDDHYPRGRGPVLDWVGYGVLLPAVLAIATSGLLARSEVERLRTFERQAVRGLAWGAAVAGVAGLLLLFAWINLEIFDHFGDGAFVSIVVERHQERDLTTSIAWALYALAILGTGMVLRRVALRWASLAFLVLSLGKVFLYDLGELEGMLRVASLTGLALSLLFVSVLYQRFVFRAESAEPAEPESGGG